MHCVDRYTTESRERYVKVVKAFPRLHKNHNTLNKVRRSKHSKIYRISLSKLFVK